MKNILKYTLIIALLSFAFSCQDDDGSRFPDFKNGASARVIVRPENLVLNFLDINSAAVVFDVYSVNSDLESITYAVTYTNGAFPDQEFPTVDVKTVSGSEFSNGMATVTITATELAQALQLPGGAAALNGGDFFTF